MVTLEHPVQSAGCLLSFVLNEKKKIIDDFTDSHESPLPRVVRSVIKDFSTFKKVQYKYKTRLRNTPIYYKFSKVKTLMAQLAAMNVPELLLHNLSKSDPQALVDHLYLLKAVSLWLSKTICALLDYILLPDGHKNNLTTLTSSLFYIHHLHVVQYNVLQISICAKIFGVFCRLYTQCRLEYKRLYESFNGISGTVSCGEGYVLFGTLPIEIEAKQFNNQFSS